MCGDVVKIFQASFSQGHEKCEVTWGIPCSCISLYGFCFSSFKSIFDWSSEDIECVIVKHDQLYKEQNTLTLLSCVDLTRIVYIENGKVTVAVLANVFGFFTENFQLEIFHKITQTEEIFDGLLFFTQGVCVVLGVCNRCMLGVCNTLSESVSIPPCRFTCLVILEFRTFLNW